MFLDLDFLYLIDGRTAKNGSSNNCMQWNGRTAVCYGTVKQRGTYVIQPSTRSSPSRLLQPFSFWMSELTPDFLNPSGWHGEIDGPEIWWVEQQESLERAGYMLRPRYRPGWKPSWVGTDKRLRSFEDGQIQAVRIDSHFLEICAHDLPAACVHGCYSDL